MAMATCSLRLLLFFYFASICLSQSSMAASSLCARLDSAFLGAFQSQCPIWIQRSFPLEVRGEDLDKELITAKNDSHYYSVLFYASWCPFSSNFQPIFKSLNSMFPHIRHLRVEESSTMPSVLSRYGVHSFPAIVLANGASMVRYHGPKDLSSLVNFYRETTGLDPVAYIAVDELSSPRGDTIKEPYIVLSLFFILLRTMTSFFPVICYHLKAFWVSHVCMPKFGIVTEISQLLVRVLHTVDFKRICIELRLSSKTWSFRNGANNARVWASSLAR
ncbi:5'-adenylylsulfate reductase-like 5 [Typha angustifolia]|uniref:5'-adenylylsulfate reductase-like 5 n=1 Tax=Typha angustifolia TaxID=59011 RepID=UPI003C2C989A